MSTSYNDEIDPRETVCWDEQGLPISNHFDDIYFSKKNGLAESRYVFLEQNQLQQRFQELKEHEHLVVGETGFGTGLNFLACWQQWQQYAPSSARLTFISIEKYPLLPNELERALALWPELKALSNQLIEEYKRSFIINKDFLGTACYQFQFGHTRLLLLIDDAEAALTSLLNTPHPPFSQPQWQGVDAWFLDGFAPAKNPEMWTQALFNRLAQLSYNNTTLATFTAAGSVRRGLIAAGFTVSKAPGFGTKREMLIGQYTNKRLTDSPLPVIKNEKKTKTNQSPWMVNSSYQPANPNATIAIIGAGIAGCHSAHALAKRGYKVSIFDSAENVADAASGNPQGVVYGKISAHPQILSDFNLSSLLYAQQHYRQFWESYPTAGEACGVLQLCDTEKLLEDFCPIAEQFTHSDFLHVVNAQEASNIAGIKLQHPALFFPYCGWLKPKALCEWLLQHNNITFHPNQTINGLIQEENTWRLVINTQAITETQVWPKAFDHIIIANASAVTQFSQTQWLPVKSIRGQVTYIDSQAQLQYLKTVICAKNYVAPAISIHQQRQHAIGASYNLHETSPELSERDHRDNIQQLQSILDSNAETTFQATGGRVGFRCTTPDYLPLVGPVPNTDSFQTDYRELKYNAQKFIPKTGTYYPGLYTNIGHGSRGLAYTPLAAEILACAISGEPPPITQSMVNTLNPARFIIRDISRNKNR